MVNKTIKTYSLYLLLLIICISAETACDVSNTHSQNQSRTFARTVSITYQGQEVSALPEAMASDGNGGAVITGQFLSQSQGANIFVARIDNEGKLMWQKSFGNKGPQVGFDIIHTNNNEFVMCGTYNDHLYLLRIGSHGRVIWQHKYQRFHEAATDSTLEHGSNDFGYTVIQAQDGGFYAAGQTMVYVPPGYYSESVGAPSLLHVNGEGKRLWFKQYLKGTGKGYTTGIVQGSNNSLIMVGPFNGIPSGIFSTQEKGVLKKSICEDRFSI